MNTVKRCKICGDVATGFNYQQLTCVSCAVFFHRNAHSAKKLVCKGEATANKTGGQCTIDLKNRKKCRHCRLKKCIAIGMVRENNGTSAFQTLEIIKKKAMTKNYDAQNFQDQFLEQLFLKSPTFLLSPFTEITAFTCGARAASLNDFERFKITEVVNAFALVGGDENRLPMTVVEQSGGSIDAYDSFWFLHVAVKVAIRFCRQLEAFSRLREEDQFVLLKPFIFSILLIRYAWSYDFELEGWPVLKDESATETIFVPSSVFDAYNSKEYTERLDQFTRRLQKEMENDLLLRDLLIVYTLFNVVYMNAVSCSEMIRYQHTFHSRLLLRYLEQKTKSIQLARKKFLSLLDLLEQFSVIKELERGMISHYDTMRIPQVIVEVYDLQQ